MRRVAGALLLVMGVIFLIANYLEVNHHHDWGFLRAFAEAGMVGGLADWFAVTALFRHPMGIPIPHTAIIPNNKERIGNTLANFLRGNFLTTNLVARKLHGMDVSSAIGKFLQRPAGGEGRMRMGASRIMGDIIAAMDDERLGALAKDALRSKLQNFNIAPLLGQLLSAMIEQGRHRPIIDGIIKWSSKTLDANTETIHQIVEERANGIMRWTGLDERLANAIVGGLTKLLAEVADDPDHQLREKGEEGLRQLAHDLQHKKQLQKKVDGWKKQMLANPAINKWLDALWQDGRAGLLRAANDPDAAMAGKLGETLTKLGSSLQEDGRLKTQLNRFARRSIVGISQSYGDNIVQLVSDTIKNWDSDTITQRVENAVGKDLQFIRINGTLVGGLVGLAIYSFTRLVN
ncbi:hypothetical protein LPB140_11335 [Sphingorhabdus lutea]|uniref:DUF445 domain-containing protein n=1 Tax=Sphingorhabdus lutea TaxID=1913578 RepID=A0A1L3JFC7_9SPHN|nr:DUF445 domain-containing protein [Sphingorhabdus lutea]APG63824.1 hypothetical protein LPB140_11335 [Sphingorhabdus lutea]